MTRGVANLVRLHDRAFWVDQVADSPREISVGVIGFTHSVVDSSDLFGDIAQQGVFEPRVGLELSVLGFGIERDS